MTIVILGPSKIIGRKTWSEADYKHMAEDKTERYVGFKKYTDSFYAKYKKLTEGVKEDADTGKEQI